MTPLLVLWALLAMAGAGQFLHYQVEHADHSVSSADNHTGHCHPAGDSNERHDHPGPSDEKNHQHNCATCKMLALQASLPALTATLLPVEEPMNTALVPWSVEFKREPHLNLLPARAPPVS